MPSSEVRCSSSSSTRPYHQPVHFRVRLCLRARPPTKYHHRYALYHLRPQHDDTAAQACGQHLQGHPQERHGQDHASGCSRISCRLAGECKPLAHHLPRGIARHGAHLVVLRDRCRERWLVRGRLCPCLDNRDSLHQGLDGCHVPLLLPSH